VKPPAATFHNVSLSEFHRPGVLPGPLLGEPRLAAGRGRLANRDGLRFAIVLGLNLLLLLDYGLLLLGRDSVCQPQPSLCHVG
jgi:hypothetical protein